MSESEEIAKAIQESAKLGSKGLEIAEKAGSFFSKVFKEPIDEIANMVTDKLRFIRWKRLIEISDEVNKIHQQRGIDKTRAVPPKLALPMFEEATLEEDDNLKILWNNLIANAMDPNFNDEIRYGFIDMINNITSREAIILLKIHEAVNRAEVIGDFSRLPQLSLDKEQIIKIMNCSKNEYAISANNLMRMQLIAPAVIVGGASIGGHQLSAYKGIDLITITALGVKFVEACIK